MTNREISAEYRRKVAAFVNREVYACISGIVAQMVADETGPNGDCDGPAYRLCQSAPDYEEAARGANWEYDEGLPGYYRTHGLNPADYNYDATTWEELCDAEGIEPHYNEIYEHWIVSKQLAEALALKGETVDLDFYGSCVWGRATTGQAICIDAVICDIYDGINPGVKEMLKIA
jgi:hypothetical protein